MAEPADLEHRYIGDTALPFISNGSPLNIQPSYRAGSNVLTSNRGYAERRPGFAAYTTDNFTSSVVRRIYCWRRWGAAFYVMICVTDATTSKVYKLQVGTDTTFQLVYNDTTTTEPFDFTAADNHVFFANGSEMWKYAGSGTSTTPWGIGTSPMFATPQTDGVPTFVLVAGTVSATVGYKYVYAYGNSTTGHVSNASNPSGSTGAFTSKNIEVTLMKSTDTQVDKVRVYRTTDGGGGIYFELPNSPFNHTAGAGTMTITDSAADTALKSTRAPVSTANPDGTSTIVGINTDPHSLGAAGNRILGISFWQNRIWGVRRNTNVLVYSAWEEIGDQGNEEESFPNDNFLEFSEELIGTAPSNAGLLVFAPGNVYKITGDSLDTFSRSRLFARMGCRERATIAPWEGIVAWLDTADVVRITDGFTQQDISWPIRDQLAGINHAQASLAFHTDGKNNWLVLVDGGNSKFWVYDLDKSQWMPSWAVTTTRAIHSGETAAGVYDLFIGYNSTRVGQLTPSTYQDFGSNYTASVRSNLWDIVQKLGYVGYLEKIGTERNAITLSDVTVLTDEDPDTGAFTSIAANVATGPPLRTAGTDLVEEWYYHRTPAARRIAFNVSWAAANSNFKFYSFDVAFKQMQRR